MGKRLFAAVIFLFVSGTAPATAEVSKIDPATAWQKVESGALVVDVRSPEEFKAGHIEGAINIPHDRIEQQLSEIDAHKNKEIVLYCGSGRRAGIAADVLDKHGFSNLYNAGGYADLTRTHATK